ncbi:uncharacterized protein LOC128679167 [Plodia interpunctella]|uniref:uncharacterized protein LOC128679167 n=1 Tax=Plodia interpunctella TaxID=58824 RepID=UPI00236877CB|nr:uncharacterized protein LOC128679167 [Plodia interpunctella]
MIPPHPFEPIIIPRQHKMARAIFILALAAITFSLTQSASLDTKSDKQSDGLSKMMASKADMDSATMLTNAMAECNETYTIDKSYTQALNESGSFPDETERIPKCYIRCVLEKTGIATEDGVYDPSRTDMFIEVFRISYPAKKSFKDMAEQCSDRKETCKCDRAYQYIKCIIENDIKNSM